MPYKDTGDLPKQVIKNLPIHAQHIYLEAFNNSIGQYQDPEKRRGGNDETAEEVAHKVVWSVVKNEYQKDEQGHWTRK